MTRKTPQELQEAKKAAQAQREQEEREAQEHQAWIVESKQRHDQLESVANGLYEELDKLARKWPSMPVTQRQLDKVNRLLAAVRELLADEGDEFADGLEDFVPAGDLPETRDVVLVLREAKDALARFKREYYATWNRYRLEV
jgi:phage terminase Nu1 subunit (DNA packaging protein)